MYIVINSLLIAEVLLLPYMGRPAETREGCKHRLTEMCIPVHMTRENLRKAKAKEKMEQLKTLLNRKERL